MDGGVIDEGAPGVVAVFELGMVGAVGVALFDSLAFFVDLTNLNLKVVVALCVALIVGFRLL